MKNSTYSQSAAYPCIYCGYKLVSPSHCFFYFVNLYLGWIKLYEKIETPHFVEILSLIIDLWLNHHILVKQINVFSVSILSLISRWVYNIMSFQWYFLPCYLYVWRTILQYNIETLNFVKIISILMEVWFNQHIIVDKSNLFLVSRFSRILWFYTIYYLSIGMFIFLFVCGTDYTSWQIEKPHFVDVL